jgi:hypothetical protein
MKVCDQVKCSGFPCSDTDKASYVVPDIEIVPSRIKVVMITEAPPNDKADYFYANGTPFYLQTTMQAFRDAGFSVSDIPDILNLGVYITTAIKCGKTQYAISLNTIKNCLRLLETEINLFPNVKAYLLGGDVAIKAMNYIWGKQSGKRVIPSGSTYKIRKQQYYYNGRRVFPSYTPAGKNFLIEKSKRRMVAEDIRDALKLTV